MSFFLLIAKGFPRLFDYLADCTVWALQPRIHKWDFNILLCFSIDKDFIRRRESSNLGTSTLSFRNSSKSMRNIIRNWLCIMIIKWMLTIGLSRDESLWDESSDLSVTIGLWRAPYRNITDLCKTTSDFGVGYLT